MFLFLFFLKRWTVFPILGAKKIKSSNFVEILMGKYILKGSVSKEFNPYFFIKVNQFWLHDVHDNHILSFLGYYLIFPLWATKDLDSFLFWLRGVHATVESDSAVHEMHTAEFLQDLSWLGTLHIAESDSAVSCTPRSFLQL